MGIAIAIALILASALTSIRDARPMNPELNTPVREVVQQPRDILYLLSQSDWPESEWNRVSRIAWCESRHIPDVIGDQGLAFGLLQIRIDYHPRKAQRYDLLDPLDNLDAGYEVYLEAGRSYWPWSCAPVVGVHQ